MKWNCSLTSSARHQCVVTFSRLSAFDANFLADGIDEVEAGFGKEDCQRYAGEAAAGAEVHDAGAGPEADEFGYGEAVQDVVFVEVVDVLA